MYRKNGTFIHIHVYLVDEYTLHTGCLCALMCSLYPRYCDFAPCQLCIETCLGLTALTHSWTLVHQLTVLPFETVDTVNFFCKFWGTYLASICSVPALHWDWDMSWLDRLNTQHQLTGRNGFFYSYTQDPITFTGNFELHMGNKFHIVCCFPKLYHVAWNFSTYS